MTNYIPPTLDWVREQVELYESSGGTEGTTLRDTGLPCIIITHKGGKTGAVRFGSTTCGPTRMSKFGTKPKCPRCACAR